MSNLFTQDLVLSEHCKAFLWIPYVTVFANRSTKQNALDEKGADPYTLLYRLFSRGAARGGSPALRDTLNSTIFYFEQ